MKTFRSLEPGLPVLVGRLSVLRTISGPAKGRPYLIIRPWCPDCRHHDHTVVVPGETIAQDALIETYISCGWDVAVGIDPDLWSDAKRTLENFKAARRRWAAERALARGEPVDRVSIERVLQGVD